MSTLMRIFWLVTLVFFGGGCSSYRVVSPPRIEDETEMAVGWESSVKVGEKVRITLTNDDKVEGKIMEISSEALTLEPKHFTEYTKYPENITGDYLPRVVLAESIRVIEMEKWELGKSILLAVGILAVLVVIAVASGLSVDFSVNPNEHWTGGR